jgi:hypothetical protein
MTPPDTPQAEPQSRQDALSDLLKQAEHMPQVEDALKAYEELQRAMSWRVVNAQGGVRYATGGNAQ